MRIEHDTWIAVADGARALILRNAGDADYPRLEVIETASAESVPTRAMATDRPGRRPDHRGFGSGGKGPRSALEATDWHRVAETEFATSLAHRLLELADRGRFARLVLVADPRSMAQIRAVAGAGLQPLLTAEVTRDLTAMPLPRIAAILAEV